MQYKKFTGIVLKKQNYREADQIITLWTHELGKIRVLARGVRLPKSKLVYSLQDLSLVEIQTTGKSFPTLIGATCLRQHQGLQQDLKKAAIAFYAAELVLKTTADESPNTLTFELIRDFLVNLERLDYSVRYYPLLESFSLKLMDSLGFSIEHAQSSFKVPMDLSAEISDLTRQDFAEFEAMNIATDRIEQVHRLINKFIEFIIERNLKSENFIVLSNIYGRSNI